MISIVRSLGAVISTSLMEISSDFLGAQQYLHGKLADDLRKRSEETKASVARQTTRFSNPGEGMHERAASDSYAAWDASNRSRRLGMLKDMKDSGKVDMNWYKSVKTNYPTGKEAQRTHPTQEFNKFRDTDASRKSAVSREKFNGRHLDSMKSKFGWKPTSS